MSSKVLQSGRWEAPLPTRSGALPTKLTTGSRVLVIYLLTAIVLPFVAMAVTGYDSLYYKNPSLSIVQMLHGAILFVVVVASALRFTTATDQANRASEFRAPFAVPLIVVSSFLMIGFIGFLRGASQWRYATEGLSASLNPVTLAFALAPTILNFLLFIEIFLVGPGSKRKLWQNISLRSMICIGLALTASGLGPMLTVLVAVLFLLFPGQIHMLIFGQTSAPSSKGDLFRRLGIVPFAVAGLFLFLIAVILGEQIKTGADSATAIEFYQGMGLSGMTDYLIGRFSTAVISFKVALSEYTSADWSAHLTNVLTPLRSFLFRFDAITGYGLGITRPDPGSLMRINYLMINFYPLNPREGTSAGLFGATVMAFPLPISLIAIWLYVALFRGIVNSLSKVMIARPTWIGCFAIHYIISGLLASPPDLLLVVDDGPVMLMLYGGLVLSVRHQLRKRQA